MKSHSPTPAGRPGMTLVELLIVTIIVGILAMIVAVPFSEARDRALTATVRLELTDMMLAIETYASVNHALPADLAELGQIGFEVAQDVALCRFEAIPGQTLASGRIELAAQHVAGRTRVATRYPGHSSFQETSVTSVCPDLAAGRSGRPPRGRARGWYR